ncbi:MAG: hydrogenase formation protein HypD [Proteobacteria bacterium]|nr:hydrogenase formation protein HypD [Pseudomonadota bacterium]
MRYSEGFRDPDAAATIGKRLGVLGKALADQGRTVSLMEVCGSHTMAIARYGIRDFLPPSIKLVSGPGCPVCVTDTGYVDTALKLAEQGLTIATFGDLVRVPGSEATLADARADGAKVEVCLSPLEALDLAARDPDTEVVFLAIGFETTIAPVVSIVKRAIESGVNNVSLLTAFKLVPPALDALISDPEININGLLCPAHVSAIIGSDAYLPYVDDHGIPCVVAGFEPLDILLGLQELCEQLAESRAALRNQYSRVVKPGGNQLAQNLISKYLQPADAPWRGIGTIPKSGMNLRDEFQRFDATTKHDVQCQAGQQHKGCKCGDVLKGKIRPNECAMFDQVCTPAHPLGPCMVSSEGSCAAYYKYVR